MSYRKILAIKFREIGDAAIWTSALQSLRNMFPEAEIDLLVREHVEPVLRGQPGLGRIHSVASRGPLHLARRLIALRAERYELAVGFHATKTLCRLIPLLGAKKRALYYHKTAADPRSSTFGLPQPGKYENAILRDHQLIRALGGEAEPPAPRLELSDEERWRARERMLPFVPDLGRDGIRLLGLLPGGRWETKRYPRDLWLQLLDRVVEARPRVPVAVLVDRELSATWALPEACEARRVPLFDDLSLRELMGMLSLVDVVIGNDSGPKHLAVALGARSLTLFGPTQVGEWHPYDPIEHPVLRVEVPCRAEGPQDLEEFRYCSLFSCDHHSCLRQIAPDRVWATARDLLGR
ncbi:MAG TPA: glycosyltransferase family 9 protein [Gemmatimonadota bacterium]|nr:glycosyltransferase family 9 protein [Gemmatimonadota bacterium]